MLAKLRLPIFVLAIIIAIDIDKESIEYLRRKYPGNVSRILQGDFLQLNLENLILIG